MTPENTQYALILLGVVLVAALIISIVALVRTHGTSDFETAATSNNVLISKLGEKGPVLSAATLTADGDLSVLGLTATGATSLADVTADSLTVTGALTADSLTITNSAGTADFTASGTLTGGVVVSDSDFQCPNHVAVYNSPAIGTTSTNWLHYLTESNANMSGYLTYSSSAALGDTWTVLVAGVYGITVDLVHTVANNTTAMLAAAQTQVWIARNATANAALPTTAAISLGQSGTATSHPIVSFCGALAEGDVINIGTNVAALTASSVISKATFVLHSVAV